MSDEDRDNILAGIYRRIGKLADSIDRLAGLLAARGLLDPLPAKQTDALAPTLPGLPDEDWTPPDLTPPPRAWGNTVKFYDALWQKFHGEAFKLDALFAAPELADATKGKIGVASYARVLSALVAAKAAERHGRDYALVEPTDALREAVEAARKGGEK
jgi:hypothetical protein